MLRTLKDLFDSVLAPPRAVTASPAANEHRLQLATAVLLVEVMVATGDVSEVQREAVMQALRQKFSLSDDEVARLVELAVQTQRGATDYHAFTSALNTQLDEAQKLRVIEAMWTVAYADGHLADHERHVLWRIADLLHVPHGAYISAKMRAQAAAGAGKPA